MDNPETQATLGMLEKTKWTNKNGQSRHRQHWAR